MKGGGGGGAYYWTFMAFELVWIWLRKVLSINKNQRQEKENKGEVPLPHVTGLKPFQTAQDLI